MRWRRFGSVRSATHFPSKPERAHKGSCERTCIRVVRRPHHKNNVRRKKLCGKSSRLKIDKLQLELAKSVSPFILLGTGSKNETHSDRNSCEALTRCGISLNTNFIILFQDSGCICEPKEKFWIEVDVPDVSRAFAVASRRDLVLFIADTRWAMLKMRICAKQNVRRLFSGIGLRCAVSGVKQQLKSQSDQHQDIVV